MARADRKICFVTGSRAEYGLLKFLIEDTAKKYKIQIVATGSHLEPRFGETYREIEGDGFKVDAKVALQIANDSPLEVTRAMGRAVGGCGEAFSRLAPDMICVLGDRYEIAGAVSAALIARIPVSHIAGGDTTEGAIDEAFRHSITKMSHLHFTTHAAACVRVRQMGEDPERIFNVGHIGIDSILRTPVMPRAELEKALSCSFGTKNLLVTMHPATLGAQDEILELLAALESVPRDNKIIFTLANADAGGDHINRLIAEFCRGRANAVAFASLGRVKYLSLMQLCDVVVGNSSSGIYEAPALKKPSVNIGDRQKGRAAADSVVHSAANRKAIASAIAQALQLDCRQVVHPYGDGRAIAKIIAAWDDVQDWSLLVHKSFFMVNG